jgi:MFS family permease
VEERVRYRAVLANPEFRAIYLAQALSLLGDQLARIALAILVYQRTGSALQASATYAVSYMSYLLGGPVLSGLADRYPRLYVMVACDLARVPLVLVLCLHSLPLWSVYLLITAVSLLAPAFDSARSALQPDILYGEAYLVGNTLLNVTIQLSQILGFVLGGAIVAATSVRGALGLDAATFLVSAGLLLRGLRTRPPAQRPDQRRGLWRDSGSGLRFVATTPRLRGLLLLAVLASVAIIPTEGLAVAVAAELGHGAVAAGLLTAAVPAGFVLGSFYVLRTPADRREALLPLLVLLSAVPLLGTPFLPGTASVLAVWVLAGIGGTVNLIAGPAFVQSCPPELRGRAYGVAAAVLMATQGVGLLLSGYAASFVAPTTAVALSAGLILVLALPVLTAQENSRVGRDAQ